MADTKPDAEKEMGENTTSPQVLQTPTPPGDMEAEVANDTNNIEVLKDQMNQNFVDMQRRNDDLGSKFSSMMDMFQQFIVETKIETKLPTENLPKSQDIRKQDAETKAEQTKMGHFQTPHGGDTQVQYYQSSLRDTGSQHQAFARMSSVSSKSPEQEEDEHTFLTCQMRKSMMLRRLLKISATTHRRQNNLNKIPWTCEPKDHQHSVTLW